jgi:hypothetical protein
MSNSRMPMDRRAFMVNFGITAGGAAVTGLLPVSLLQAGEACRAATLQSYPDPCGDWTLDDICNAYPPYAFDIRRSVNCHAPLTARVAAADQAWVG